MDAGGFLADVEARGDTLRALAALIDADDASVKWAVEPGGRLALTGMGSSWFAADTMARRMRAAGLRAVADVASSESLGPPSPDLTVVAVSAGGGSAETLRHVAHHRGVSRTIVLTNRPDRVPDADAVIGLHAGEETGGVACRSYTHTLVMLMQLQRQLQGSGRPLGAVVRAAAAAVDDLLARRDTWLPPVVDLLDGPNGSWLLAPAERLGSALQGALMLREGPRRAADGCETGDWSHVDVYLTKTLDYRALVFTGSRYQPDAQRWLAERNARWASVGPGDAAMTSVRFRGDDDPDVAVLAEIVVPELAAAALWAAG